MKNKNNLDWIWLNMENTFLNRSASHNDVLRMPAGRWGLNQSGVKT